VCKRLRAYEKKRVGSARKVEDVKDNRKEELGGSSCHDLVDTSIGWMVSQYRGER
jgi:hypothetical protein